MSASPVLSMARRVESSRYAPHNQRFDVRYLAPIAFISLQDQLDALLLAHELIGASADRMLLEAVIAHSLNVLLRHHPPGTRRHRAIEGHEIRPGLFEVEAHPQGIDDLDRLDFLPEERGALPVVAVEAKFHILGGERVTVVEGDPLAQLELVRQAVFTLAPGLGQAGSPLIPRHRFHQRVVYRVEKQKRRDPIIFGRLKEGRGDSEVDRPSHLALRLRRDVWDVQAANKPENKADDAQQ